MKQYIDSLNNALSSMLDAFNNPQMVHTMVVHVPIAICVLGMLGTFLLLLSGARWHGLRWALVVLYVIGMLTAWFASETGETAKEMLATRGAPAPLSGGAAEVLDEHARLGDLLWALMAVTALLIVFTAPKKGAFRVPAITLAMLAAIGSGAYCAAIAHHGGSLVYEHGVGAPTSQNNLMPLPEPVIVQPTPTPPPVTKKDDKDTKKEDRPSLKDGKTEDDPDTKKRDPIDPPPTTRPPLFD